METMAIITIQVVAAIIDYIIIDITDKARQALSGQDVFFLQALGRKVLPLRMATFCIKILYIKIENCITLN